MNAKTKLEKLKEQKSKLEHRIQLAEARAKTFEKKQDTRRKILVGAYYLDKAAKDDTMEEINKLMDGYLTRDNDRALFGLAKKKQQK